MSSMNVGLFTDGLPDRSLSDVLRWLASKPYGIEHVEIGTGGYSPAPRHGEARRSLAGLRRGTSALSL